MDLIGLSKSHEAGSKVFQLCKDNNMLTFSSGQNSVFASSSLWNPGLSTIETLYVDAASLIFQPTAVKISTFLPAWFVNLFVFVFDWLLITINAPQVVD